MSCKSGNGGKAISIGNDARLAGRSVIDAALRHFYRMDMVFAMVEFAHAQ